MEQQPAMAKLTDDILLEILWRVPYRSLCRFKCVSRSWRALCSDPYLRSKLPRTLSGFFYRRSSTAPATDNPSRYHSHHLTNVSGTGLPVIDPSLSFLPYADVVLLDSCDGLLLCQCRQMPWQLEYDFVVCNPATKKWTLLPDLELYHRVNTVGVYLGFDQAVSSHFTVFLCLGEMRVVDEGHEDLSVAYYYQITGVEIYSSETGVWTPKQSEWGEQARVLSYSSLSVFFNGMLHLTTLDSSVLSVDREGKTWRMISTPCVVSFIGMSRGHLYALHEDDDDSELSVWVPQDYGGEQWILKHTIITRELFEKIHLEDPKPYMVAAIHAERSLIFLIAGADKNLISYDMETGNVHAICSLGDDSEYPYLPYIPCYLE